MNEMSTRKFLMTYFSLKIYNKVKLLLIKSVSKSEKSYVWKKHLFHEYMFWFCQLLSLSARVSRIQKIISLINQSGSAHLMLHLCKGNPIRGALELIVKLLPNHPF